MKTNNFNLEQFKTSKKAQTKLGNPVNFITVTNDNKLLVKVFHRNRIVGTTNKAIAPMVEGTVEKYELDGRKYRGTTTEFDLVMA